MVFLVTVMYPQGDFNLDYYLKTHMPLVENAWKSKGLKNWQVQKIGPQADGSAVRCPFLYLSCLYYFTL